MSGTLQQTPRADGSAAQVPVLEKPTYHEPTPMSLIAVAMESGVDTDRLEKLLELQERWEANELVKAERAAELAYNQSMAECQSDIQPVKATLKNTQTNSVYADLTAIDDAIRPVYTKHGFSISEGTEKSELENHVYVYIDVLHRDGHAKRYGDDFPLDNAGIKGTVNKTAIHAKASTKTYARRYLITGVFNIAIARHDRDGNGPKALLSDQQRGVLQSLINSIHPDEDALGRCLKFAGVDALDQVPAHHFLTIKQKLTDLAAKYNESN